MNKIEDHTTPGPWEIAQAKNNSDFLHNIVYAPGKPVAFILTHGEEISTANARLIACAPEMRDFIADMMQWHDEQLKVENLEDLYHLPQEMVNRAETILKKAYNF